MFLLDGRSSEVNMKEGTYKHLDKNQKVAVFVSVLFVLIIFIIPSFDLLRYTPPTLNPADRLFNETQQLGIYEVREGFGRGAMIGDRLTVHYEGSFPDGSVFDSSYDGMPFTFLLGRGDVISGWDQGLRGMQEGALRILVVPAHLGYGDTQIGPIPAGSTLIFEVELIELESPQRSE